jgi:hypothetical protein
MIVINMDHLNVWIHACEQRTTLFQCVMPMTMENLAIAQHQDTLCYATICGGDYWFWIWKFKWGNYVYLQ